MSSYAWYQIRNSIFMSLVNESIYLFPYKSYGGKGLMAETREPHYPSMQSPIFTLCIATERLSRLCSLKLEILPRISVPTIWNVCLQNSRDSPWILELSRCYKIKFFCSLCIQAILMDIVTDTACNIVNIHWMNINLEKYFLFKKFKIF